MRLFQVLLYTVLGQLLLIPAQFSTRGQALGTPAQLGVIGIAGDSRSTPNLPHSDWPRGMADMLQTQQISLLNLALGGAVATDDVRAGWPVQRTGRWQVQELIDAQVDLVVIAFGVNDINNRDRSAVEVFGDLSVMVGMCRQARIPFLVATVEFMFAPHQEANNPIVSQLNDLIRLAGWPLLDFATVTNSPKYTDDGLHTNELGRLVKSRLAANVFVKVP